MKLEAREEYPEVVHKLAEAVSGESWFSREEIIQWSYYHGWKAAVKLKMTTPYLYHCYPDTEMIEKGTRDLLRPRAISDTEDAVYEAYRRGVWDGLDAWPGEICIPTDAWRPFIQYQWLREVIERRSPREEVVQEYKYTIKDFELLAKDIQKIIERLKKEYEEYVGGEKGKVD